MGDLLGHGKNATERGTRTNLRQQREGLVRTRREWDQARGAHFLETAEEGTCQNTERMRPSEATHFLEMAGERFVRTRKEATERCPPTSWRRQRERLVRKWNERNRLGHSLPGHDRGRDLSGHRKKASERRALTSWRQQREKLIRTQKECDQAWGTHSLYMAGGDLSGHGKTATERGAPTN